MFRLFWGMFYFFVKCFFGYFMAFVKCLNLLGNVGDFFGECSLVNCEMADFLLLTITLIIVECSNSCLYKLIIMIDHHLSPSYISGLSFAYLSFIAFVLGMWRKKWSKTIVSNKWHHRYLSNVWKWLHLFWNYFSNITHNKSSVF